MGADSQPFHWAGGPVNWHNVHADHARKDGTIGRRHSGGWHLMVEQNYELPDFRQDRGKSNLAGPTDRQLRPDY